MPEIPNSVPVSGFIAPLDDLDQYPSHLALYGKGGFRTVQTLAERDAIPAERRESGMEVYIIADGSRWKMADDLTTWTVGTVDAMVAGGQLTLDIAAQLSVLDSTTTIQPGSIIRTAGYYAAGDGGGNTFYYDASAPIGTLDNGGNTRVDAAGRVFRQVSQEQNARQWGCKADPVNAPGWDDSTPLQKALDVVKSVAGSTLYIPAGAYHLIASLNGTTNAIGYKIRGDGWSKTILRNGEGTWPILDCTGAVGVVLEEFTVHGNLPNAGANIPSCGILMGRPASNATAGSHVLKHVRVWGNFTKCGIFMNSAENSLIEECEFYAGDNTGGPWFPMTAFISSGGSPGRGIESKYNPIGSGAGGNSCVTYTNCRFQNWTPTSISGYATSYCLELDGVMSHVLINPYFYSRFIPTQVYLNNNTTATTAPTGFDGLTILAPRHEYLPTSATPTPGIEPCSYRIANGKQIKNWRIDNGTLMRIIAEDNSWITNVAIRDVVWKCDPVNSANGGVTPPMLDAWVLCDADIRNHAITLNPPSYLQVTSPTFNVRNWSRNVSFGSVQSYLSNLQNSPNSIVQPRGLFWDGATVGAGVIIPLTNNNITTDDFTIYLRLKLPLVTQYSGNHIGVTCLTPAGSGVLSSNTFRVRFTTGKVVEAIMFASGGNTRTLTTSAEFLTNSATSSTSEIVDLAWVRKTSDTTMKFYINGLRCTAVTDTPAGTAPTWGMTLSGAYWSLGIADTTGQIYKSDMYRAILVYRALSDTEVAGLSRGQITDSNAVIPDLAIGLSAHIPDRGDRLLAGSITSGVGHLTRPNRPGYRTGSASPAASVLPAYIGEDYMDTTAKLWWKSVGMTNADWKQITN